MLRAGREDKQVIQSGRPGTLLDALEQPLTITLVLHVLSDGQAGHFANSFVGEWVECGATEDDPIVFNHSEVADFAFDQCPVASDQRAIFFQWTQQGE